MIPMSPKNSSVSPIVLHPKIVSRVRDTMKTFFRVNTSRRECTITGILSTSFGFTTTHTTTHAANTPTTQKGMPTAIQVPKDIVNPAFCSGVVCSTFEKVGGGGILMCCTRWSVARPLTTRPRGANRGGGGSSG